MRALHELSERLLKIAAPYGFICVSLFLRKFMSCLLRMRYLTPLMIIGMTEAQPCCALLEVFCCPV